MVIAPSGLKMKFLLLVEVVLSKTQSHQNGYPIFYSIFTQTGNSKNNFRATEKWSQSAGLKTLTNHQLTNMEYYPELFVVPSDFCQ